MALSRQIGGSNEERLLWEITKGLEKLIAKMGGVTPTALSDLTQDPLHRTVTDTEKTTWNAKEDIINKTTALSAASTDVEYPSAKSVYDELLGKQDSGAFVPYTGATQPVDLGTHSLGTDEIKTNTSTPTDLLITTGAQKTLVLDTGAYRDEYPAMVIPASGATAPDAVGHTIGAVARTLYGFDGNATQEILSGSIEIPHDYKLGEAIEVHIHWRPSTTGTGTVIWYLDYEYSPPQAGPIPQTTIQLTSTLSSNKQYFHLLDTFGNLPQPSTPFGIGGKIGFNLRRTPTTDTYSGDALLEQIAIHIPVDTLGSRQIYIK